MQNKLELLILIRFGMLYNFRPLNKYIAVLMDLIVVLRSSTGYQNLYFYFAEWGNMVLMLILQPLEILPGNIVRNIFDFNITKCFGLDLYESNVN